MHARGGNFNDDDLKFKNDKQKKSAKIRKIPDSTATLNAKFVHLFTVTSLSLSRFASSSIDCFGVTCNIGMVYLNSIVNIWHDICIRRLLQSL